jgi:predicted pyridoxine 5'-phosphate oxidase superfamily flavin-nucleotide-binding protein
MYDPSTVVACDAELEAVVGKRPGAVMLKSIRFLDEHCEQFLACSPFAVIGTTTGDGSLQTISLGGEPGHAAPRSDTVLELGDVSGSEVVDGAPAGLIALVPGYGETLRINGRLRVRDHIATLEVGEVLLHCAKAVMRSELWTTPGAPEPGGDAAVPTVAAFLADSPFVVVVSIDANGHADASPKGDPRGLIRQIDDTTIAIADRPGNRRTDTLHNLMDDPRVALLAMQPGSQQVA